MLSDFLRAQVPEWEQVRASIRGAGLMMAQGMLKEQQAGEIVEAKVGQMVGRLTLENLQKLEMFLRAENDIDGLILDAIAACLKMKERETK